MSDEMGIIEFKAIIDALAQQYPEATVDFVYPKNHGGKRRSQLGHMTSYSMLVRSTRSGGLVRIYIDWAREDSAPEFIIAATEAMIP